MKFLISIVLLVASGVLFFLFTDPTYRDIKSFRAQASVFESALSNAKELQKVRDTILADYNSISPQDRDRLLKLLPNTVDNVRLVRDIDNIAARHDMTLRSVRVDIEKDANAVGPTTRQYGSAIVSFTVSAPYAALLAFFAELERSLRLIDIVHVAFVSSDEDLSEYQISIRTYWLK